MLKKIRLELARSPEFPEGSAHHGYEFKAPLKPDGTFDLAAWRKLAKLCTVHRFWRGEDDEVGELVHHSKHGWAFSYEPGEADDEPIFRFGGHVFREGEYVSITEHDGVERTFRVVMVEDAPV
ncbi:MAG: hypothetical protein HYR63_20670 [Proteobacteria bacterium]|nr:hypothetical protein [Pseudomonadota bacterium]MBI3497110.1 hypothetical protein [Pseudomonadota bacterium]